MKWSRLRITHQVRDLADRERRLAHVSHRRFLARVVEQLLVRRQAGQRSADLLIVPANEWKEIKHIHTQMAAFRAIENGVSLVRPAASGISSAFDPWGRLLGVADYFAPGDRTLTAQVPVGGVRTFYARTGDLFAWLCVTGLVVALWIAAVSPGRLSGRVFNNRVAVHADPAR